MHGGIYLISSLCSFHATSFFDFGVASNSAGQGMSDLHPQRHCTCEKTTATLKCKSDNSDDNETTMYLICELTTTNIIVIYIKENDRYKCPLSNILQRKPSFFGIVKFIAGATGTRSSVSNCFLSDCIHMAIDHFSVGTTPTNSSNNGVTSRVSQ